MFRGAIYRDNHSVKLFCRLCAAQGFFKVVCGFILVVEMLSSGSQIRSAIMTALAGILPGA